MSECVCVCMSAYAKLFCYNLMTQTHAVRAIQTGVGDSCIFNIVCVSILICMHACALCVHACCAKAHTHMYLCKYVQLCACVCLRAGVLSWTGQCFTPSPRLCSDRQPIFLFFFFFGTSLVEADCLDQVQTEKKKQCLKTKIKVKKCWSEIRFKTQCSVSLGLDTVDLIREIVK